MAKNACITRRYLMHEGLSASQFCFPEQLMLAGSWVFLEGKTWGSSRSERTELPRLVNVQLYNKAAVE
jgi:hypothetical protein